MAGYTRQSSADIIATAVVRANPLNVEYNALRDAFNASTGHKHDGTAAEGAYVPLIADSDALNKVVIDTSNNRVGVFVEVSSAAVEQIRIQDGSVVPVTNNDIDLGTSSLQFKDLFIDGTANIDSLVADTADINAGTIDGVTIGGSSAAAGTFTALAATGTSTLTTVDINGGAIDGTIIGANSATSSTFTTATTTGLATLATADINGGTIDGAVIGGSSALAITGTVVTASTNFAGALTGNVTGNVTGNSAGTHTGAVIGDVTGNVTAASGTSSFNNLTVNGTLNMNAGTSATIENLSAPSNANDAARKADVDAVSAAKLNLSGGTMSGDIAMGGNTVSGLGAPSASADAATKGYVDTSVSNLVDSAPGTLDTLNELAAALGDDPDFATTITNSIATKLPLAGGTMTGDIVLGSNKATSTATPATDDTLTRKGYVDTQDALKLNLAGGTMSGAIAMGTNKITGLGDPTANQDASTKAYTDTQRDTRLPLAGGTMTGGITMGNNKVTATYTPSANADLTTKTYVDGILGSATSAATSASAAATSATNAASSATASASSASAAAASYDSFDDRYLGAKSSAPSVDNDGDALTTGALYWNTSNNSLFIWTGSAWNAAAFDTSGALIATNNLSDLNNAATARTNLGFNTGVDAHLNTGTASSGEVLSWNGSDYDWEEVPAGGETSFTLSSTVSVGDPVGLKNDGTVAKIDSTLLGPTVTSGSNIGVISHNKYQLIDGAFDAANERLVAVTTHASGVSSGSQVIAARTDYSTAPYLSFPEAPQTLYAGTASYFQQFRITYIGSGKYVASYLKYNLGDESRTFGFKVITLSGGQGCDVTVGNETALVFPTGQSPSYGQNTCRLEADPSNTGNFVFCYVGYNGGNSSSNRSQAWAVAGSVSGTTITLGSNLQLSDATGDTYTSASGNFASQAIMGLSYDSTRQKFLVSYQQLTNDGYVAYKTLTLGGTGNRTITAGSQFMPGTYPNGYENGVFGNVNSGSLTYNATVGRHLQIHRTATNSQQPKFRIIDIAANGDLSTPHTGNTVSLFNNQEVDISRSYIYNSTASNGSTTFLFTAADSSNSDGITNDFHVIYPIVVSATGGSLSKGGAIDIGHASVTSTSAQELLLYINNDRFLIGYADSDLNKTSSRVLVNADKGATASEFIGFAKDTTGTVTTLGGVASGLSGLAANTDYYVADSGTLQTTDNGNAVGRATGSTSIFVDNAGGADLYAANPSSATHPVASGANAVSIGSGSVASGEKSFALLGGTASGQYSMALNNYAVASAEKSISLGWLTDATAVSSVAIGTGTQSSGSHSVALGQAYASGADSFAAAIGNSSNSYGASGQESVAIGKQAKATGLGSLAISANRYGPATSTSNGAVAIGDTVTASGSLSLAMGYNTTASASSAVAIGSGITNSTANQIVLGGTTQQVKISNTYTLPTADGSANQVLTTNGSGAVTFVDAAGAADDIFYENNTTIASNYTITSGKNAMTAGPVTIASGVTVTVPSGSRWAVV